MKVALAKTAIVMDWVKRLRAAGTTVTVDKSAGTVVAVDGDTVVYSALQKGKGGPWMVMCKNSDRIQWS